MGVMCSDPGHRPGLGDLRYAVDTEFDDLNDSDFEMGSHRGCAPSIRGVPIPADRLRGYRLEKKNEESFFDLDSVDEASEVPEKAKSDITSWRLNRNQPIRLNKKQDSYLTNVNGLNGRVGSYDTRSVCSDQPRKRTRRTLSVSSDRAVYSRPKTWENGKDTVNSIVFSRGQCTDEDSVSSIYSDRVDYVGQRASAYTVSSKNCITSPQGYCTDELSNNASLELAEKSESESDSLKFIETRSEARKSMRQSLFEEFLTTDNLTTKSVSRKTHVSKENKEKLSSPSCTDSTSIRSSVSPAGSTNVTWQRRDGSFVYRKPDEQKLNRDRNSCDKILDFEQLPEVELLVRGGTPANTIETRNPKPQDIAVAGETDKEDDGEEVLIFTTTRIINPFIKDGEETGFTHRKDKNVILP